MNSLNPFRDGHVTFLDILGFRTLRFSKDANSSGKEALQKTSTKLLWISDSIIISGFDDKKESHFSFRHTRCPNDTPLSKTP